MQQIPDPSLYGVRIVTSLSPVRVLCAHFPIQRRRHRVRVGALLAMVDILHEASVMRGGRDDHSVAVYVVVVFFDLCR